MKHSHARCTLGLLLLISSFAHAQLCSTQKVNGNCALVFDRLDPVSLPTIQMRENARISVSVKQPLPYETLSLDPQTFQAIAPADQTQGLVAGILPSLKAVSTATLTPLVAAHLTRKAGESPGVEQVKKDLRNLAASLANPFPTIQTFVTNSQSFYAQIQEAVAPLPRPRDINGNTMRPSTGTPAPWTSFSEWAAILLCELSAPECTNDIKPTFNDLMAAGISVQTLLTPVPAPTPCPSVPPVCPAPPAPPPQAPLQFDTATFDKSAKAIEDEIETKLKPEDHPEQYLADLADLRARETSLVKDVPTYAAAWLVGVTAINKDLQTYFVNIKETAGAVAGDTKDLGFIDDPRRLSAGVRSSNTFLGRLVTYSVNAINQIGVTTTAVPTTAQKTSIVTITVLYAGPIFEVSTGALFSRLPNRTFANQTLVNINPGSNPTTGDIILTQSTVRPIVLPYVAANWRLGHDFTIGGRRSAAYFTTAVAFNAYNTTAEYAVGPSFSWRMIMVSPLFHLGHDTHLTQGETVNQVWCNTSAPAGSPTACVGAPPAPSTKFFWRGAFALGIGIRVPTAFGTTAGH